MNIVLPSFQYKGIFIPDYQETSSDNEIILFFENENQLVVMNETATCVWQFITNHIKENNNEGTITIDIILNHLHNNFETELPCDEEIIKDIVDIINDFINNKMIGYSNDLL